MRTTAAVSSIDFGLSNPQGCKLVAGGWSVAETTGNRESNDRHPERMQAGLPIRLKKTRTPSGCDSFSLGTGGLRCASTTGYWLATLRVAGHHQAHRLKLCYIRLNPEKS